MPFKPINALLKQLSGIAGNLPYKSISCVLGLFLAIPANSQLVSVQTDKFLGLNDSDNPASIGDGCQSCLNVESSIRGNALTKRKGYSRQFSLTVATSPVSGSHTFIDTNGNRQDVVCHDHYCAKSTNGQAFINFISTAGGTAIPTRWSFVDINGKLYGANDLRDPILEYDGTTLRSPATMPQGSILELTKDRLLIADVAAAPNAIYYSQQGTYTNFTTGILAGDPYVDFLGTPGNKVTGLKYALGRLYAFKTISVAACLLGDQYTSRCFPITNTIGTTDPGSIVEVPEGIFFRGNDRNYWKIDASGIVFPPLSRQIGVLVSSQTTGSVQNNTQGSQSDWQNGTRVPANSWDTTTQAGVIFPSSTTVVFSTNVLTQTAYESNGVIDLTSTTAREDWTVGSGTTTGRYAWNDLVPSNNLTSFSQNSSLGSGFVSAQFGNFGLNNSIASHQIAFSSGSWSFQYAYVAGGGVSDCGGNGLSSYCFEFKFMDVDTNNYYAVYLGNNSQSLNKTVGIMKNVSGTKTYLSATTQSIASSVIHTYKIERNSAGAMALYFDGVWVSSAADTSVSGQVDTKMACTGYVGAYTQACYFGNVFYYSYQSTGTAISTIVDTSFSTPTFGAYSSTFTVLQNVEGQVAFYTRVSTSPNNDKWDAWIASSDTLRVTNAQKRYVQQEAVFTTSVATKTPTVSYAGLSVATTGQWFSQCIQPNSNISAWGTLSCAQILSGNGSLVFYATSAATCASLPNVPPLNGAGALQSQWTVQTNNQTMGISTNTALEIGFRSLLTSATDQAAVDACTVYWNNGVIAPPVWGVYDSIRNAVYWDTSINNSSTNNRMLKYDLNLNEWFPFSINGSAPLFANSQLYFGDSTGGYWNLYGGVDNDNGAAINAYYKTRDYGSDDPFSEKNLRAISIIARNQVTGSLMATYTTSNNISNSYSVSLSTTAGITYVRANYALPLGSSYQFFNFTFGNSGSTPFEIDGYKADLSIQPWKPANP